MRSGMKSKGKRVKQTDHSDERKQKWVDEECKS